MGALVGQSPFKQADRHSANLRMLSTVKRIPWDSAVLRQSPFLGPFIVQ
jgi:hypothetical protein